jgi:DNA-binding transcriptional ArsR family regulator
MSTTGRPDVPPAAAHPPAGDSKVHAVNALATTLFGKTRRQLLALLYGQPAQRFYLRQLTMAAGVAVGAAQRELAELTAAGILRRDVEGRQVYFQANVGCLVFTELQSIVRKTGGRDEGAPTARDPLQAALPPRPAVSRPATPRASPPPNPAFVWMTRR